MGKGGPWRAVLLDVMSQRRRLLAAVTAAIVAAACWGSGLGMMLPVFHLLLQRQQTLSQLIQTYLVESDIAPLQAVGRQLMAFVPDDRFLGFVIIIAVTIVLALLAGGMRYLHAVLIFSAVHRVQTRWRRRLLRRMLATPLDIAMKQQTGDQVSRMMHDTDHLAGGMRALMSTGVTKLLQGVAAGSLAVWLNWRLSLLALVGLSLLGLMLRFTSRRIRGASEKALALRSGMFSMAFSALRHLRVVRAQQAEGYERRRFASASRELQAQELRLMRTDALTKPATETLTILGLGMVGCVAAYLIFRRDIAPEQFMTVLALLGATAASLQRAVGLWNTVHACTPSALRVVEALTGPTERDESPVRLGRHRRSIELRNITYAYPGQTEPALRNVSLTIAHGTTVALVGANGSGKTTLAGMIPRHFEPAEGAVLVDGVDVRNVSRRSLRSQVGLVTQQTVLFRATVANNIAYGRPYIPMTRIVAAAQAAMAHDFILRLPKGYDTPLGDDGIGISGGERQRLCMARALLRNPAILILDEATSQVDAESEARINEVIKALRQHRTTIIVAHRLSTVMNADVIVVMARGAIVDQGTHDQLMRRCPTYRDLVHKQLYESEVPATG